ncbi:C2H2 type zinc finger domain-containing protein [Fusarium oxysporum f. sp. phaseoli]
MDPVGVEAEEQQAFDSFCTAPEVLSNTSYTDISASQFNGATLVQDAFDDTLLESTSELPSNEPPSNFFCGSASLESILHQASTNIAGWPDSNDNFEGVWMAGDHTEQYGPMISSSSRSSICLNTSGSLSSNGEGLDQGPVEYQLSNLDIPGDPPQAARPVPPKAGTRFSLKTLKILQRWYSIHIDHPYPRNEEMQALQEHTDLSKTQISNWMANTRRRHKLEKNPRPSTGPSSPPPAGIPNRPATPAPSQRWSRRDTSPLQRWVDSPAESEPASIAAIAEAVASSPPRDPEMPRNHFLCDDGTDPSFVVSSTSSMGTFSGRSSTSAHSSVSGKHLFGKRRRRRKPNRRRVFLGDNVKPFECTFCTETFQKKYDWERHEKTIHLRLERWLCSPNGSRAVNPQTELVSCVFCGEPEPSNEHIERHNPSSCQERIFNRKDHLKQHLRLVHNSQLIGWATGSWQTSISNIQSRCGICDSRMITWAERAIHLADHFKIGLGMSSWKGDWGFEESVLGMVELAIPPYLIHTLRATPFPFQGSSGPVSSPDSAFELIALELAHFMHTYHDLTSTVPDTAAIQLEACRIILSSDVQSVDVDQIQDPGSWLRDLITSNDEIMQKARFSPIRSSKESRLAVPIVIGKKNLFDYCPFELELKNSVQAKIVSGHLDIPSRELQDEATEIIKRTGNDVILLSSDFVVGWLVELARSSSRWLRGFRMRAHLPPEDRIPNPLSNNEATSTNTDHVSTQESLQTAPELVLLHGCHKNDLAPNSSEPSYNMWPTFSCDPDLKWTPFHSKGFPSVHATNSAAGLLSYDHPSVLPLSTSNIALGGPDYELAGVKTGLYMLNDPNIHQRLARALGRWTRAMMSPANPNSHIPTDEELRHHARWITFEDSEDVWHKTAADNDEWLYHFKVNVGILPTVQN